MPFPMRIQPVDGKGAAAAPTEIPAKPPPTKSRLKRLFERQFPGVLRASAVDRIIIGGGDSGKEKEREREVAELEPTSLARMVQSFMEGSHEPPSSSSLSSSWCGRRRGNCFNGNCDDTSDDDFDFFSDADDASDVLKSLVPCASTAERNLLADTSRIIVGGKGGKGSDRRRMVTDGLVALGYDAAICRSRWDRSKSPSFPAGTLLSLSLPQIWIFLWFLRFTAGAGEYKYVDVIMENGDRLLVDVDFRSEFEIARPTKTYRAALQLLPAIFVGRPDRLRQIVAVASEAARQSLKKKGLDFPPWRKPEYMKSKWLSPHKRLSDEQIVKNSDLCLAGELELRRDKSGQLAAAEDGSVTAPTAAEGAEEAEMAVVRPPWKLPAVKPKAALEKSVKVVTGLAAVEREEI